MYIDKNGELVDGFKTPFNHDTNAESDRVGLLCPDDGKTQQHQAKEADINTIVRNFGLTGQLPTIPLPPSIEEFADIFDFQSAMNTMAAARHSFSMLSAEVRDAFHNDPHRFVSTVDAWLEEPNEDTRARHLENLRAMGLAVAPGPKADQTTLGDLLAALKTQRQGDTPPTPPNGP